MERGESALRRCDVMTGPVRASGVSPLTGRTSRSKAIELSRLASTSGAMSSFIAPEVQSTIS